MTLNCIRAGFGDAPPKMSVVSILCDFGEDALSDCAFQSIAGLLATVPEDSEIIFVANSPSAKLQAELKRVSDENERVIVIATSKNLGVVAKNLGYEVAQGEYIFSVDGDVVVRETRAFTKCIEYMDAHLKTAIMGPCGVRMLDRVWTREAWGVSEELTDAHHCCGYDDTVDFGGKEELDGEKLDSIPSMFWCFRKSLLREIGPLSWRYGPFVGSDSDFCFRAKEAGHHVRCMRVPITHLNGGGHSHKAIVDLQELKVNHIAALYDDWYPKLHLIGEYHG